METKILIFFLSVSLVSANVRYDNYTLFKVIARNEEHLGFLRSLQDSSQLDFWKVPTNVGDYASVVSSPEIRENFEHSLTKRSIYSEIVLDNIQEALDAQSYSRRKRDVGGSLSWQNFQTYGMINSWLYNLAETHSDVVSLIVIGQTYEGRNITGVKISRGTTGRSFVLEAGQIGADWLSPTVLTYIIEQLVNNNDPEVRRATEEFDWYIFPVMNPDGQEYSQNRERLWLKNRRPVDRNNVGVDLTKNWNSHWGVSGSSFNPADNNYPGPGPFSELETRQLSSFIDSISDNLVGLLSFRAFGQRLLIPFAFTTDPMYNYNEMVTIGRRAMGSLAVKYNTPYLVGTSAAFHDGATGSIADWVKHRYNKPVVATYLLRDQGMGYIIRDTEVLPSCEETFDSLLAIIREAKFINVL